MGRSISFSAPLPPGSSSLTVWGATPKRAASASANVASVAPAGTATVAAAALPNDTSSSSWAWGASACVPGILPRGACSGERQQQQSVLEPKLVGGEWLGGGDGPIVVCRVVDRSTIGR